MGVVIKSSIRYSIILYVGILLGYINTILIFPNFLSQAEFGFTRLLIAVASLITQFAQLGIPSILIKFFPNPDEEKQKQAISFGLIVTFIGGLIASVLLVAFETQILKNYAEESLLLKDYYLLLIPFFLALLAFNLFDSYLRILFKNSFTAFLNNILLRVLWLIIVLIYGFGYISTAEFLYTYVGGQLLISVLAIIYTAYLHKLKITLYPKISKISLKEITQFGGFTLLSGLSTFMINRVDIIMLGGYEGLVSIAIYSIAFYMSTVIIVPAKSISRTSAILATQGLRDNDLGKVEDIYRKTATNQLLLGCLIFIGIIVNYQSILAYLPDEYSGSFWAFVFLGGAKVVDTSLGINGSIIINSKYYRFDIVSSIILLVLTVVTNMLFIPVYGLEGAAMATAFSLVLYNLAKYLFVKVQMGLSPFSLPYLFALLLLIPCFLIGLYLPKINIIFIDIIVRSSIVVAVFVLLNRWLNASPEINALLNKFFMEIKKKISK